MLLYRNTPIQSIILLLAQLLFHCQLCDSIPSQPILYKPHPEWVVVVQHHEEILHNRNAKIVERYNKYTHNLSPLKAGDIIAIESPLNHRWNTSGKIISPQPDRQYGIRVDGSGRIIFWNHRFLRKCELKPASTPIPSPTLEPITPSSNTSLLHPYPPASPGNGTRTAIDPPKQTTYTSPRLQSLRIPQALSRLLPHNRLGLKEVYSPHTTQPTHRVGGEGRCRSHYSNMQNKQEQRHLPVQQPQLVSSSQTKNKMGSNSIPSP